MSEFNPETSINHALLIRSWGVSTMYDKKCSFCENTFRNNIPWDARYCPYCGIRFHNIQNGKFVKLDDCTWYEYLEMTLSENRISFSEYQEMKEPIVKRRIYDVFK